MSDFVSDLDIQRCVDGELSEEEQQQLLLQLEASDSGWRHLALSYVESQVVAGVCRDAGRVPACSSPPLAAPTGSPVVPRRRTAMPAWTMTAAAALVGVGLGLLAGAGRDDRGAESNQLAGDSGGAADAASETIDTVTADAVAPEPVMSVEFADASGDATQWSLPVYSADDLGAEYWQAQDVLPESVRQDLSRWGYRLDHAREFYSIPLDDGREIAVPVDSVQVRYAGL